MITSKDFSVLKKWNKRATTNKLIRLGVEVVTPRGIGIVVHRNKGAVWVAYASTALWCERYQTTVDEVELYTFQPTIPKTSLLYKGAWQHIEDEAINENQKYEIAKHQAIVNTWASDIKATREERTITSEFGSNTYVRFIGDNFDFEINVSRPFFPSGDRVLFALNKGDGYITDINGFGWIYRRKIIADDISYGLAKYAAPQPQV